MPAVSKAQLRWVNTPAGKKALGSKGVKEWDSASRGLNLPERVKPMKKETKKTKEIGIPKGASKGSKKDLAADKRLMKSSKKGK
jgi:hypothetical protein